MSEPVGLRKLFGLLRQRNVALFAYGNLVSMSGTWMQRLAVGLVAWQLTGSTWWLGVVALADMFPTVIFSPLSGVLADRYERRRIVALTQWASVLACLVFIGLSLAGWLGIHMLVGIVLVSGIITGLDHSIRQAMIGNMVSREDLQGAVALSALTFNLARMLGPFAAGPLLVYTGLEVVIAINAVSYLAYIWCLSHFEMRPSAPRTGAPGASVLGDMLAGYRYVLVTPQLLSALLVLVVICLFLRPVFELLPAVAAMLQEDWPDIELAIALSLITTALGLGSSVGVLTASTLAERLGSRVTLWATAFGTCVCSACLTMVSGPVALPALLGVLGFAMLVNSVIVQMSVHFESDPAFRGRTISLQSMIFRGAPALGALPVGGVAQIAGFEATLLIGAAIAGVLLTACFFAFAARP